MSRYRYILHNTIKTNAVDPSIKPKIIGLFPFNVLIDMTKSSISNGKLEFYESAIDGLKKLAETQTSVVLFINQFKNAPLTYEQFNSLNQAIERFITQFGVRVNGLYWCPMLDKKDPHVVPNTGMFIRATENQKINWDNIPVLSTSENDLLAAKKSNATPIKIGTGPTKWAQFSSLDEWVSS